MKKIIILILSLFITFGLVACGNDDVVDDNDRPIIPSGPIPGTDDSVYCSAEGYDYVYADLEYDLVWNDEFDGEILNLDNWHYEVNGDGGGNNELQYYTDQNTSIADGILTITAKLEDYLGKEYTSSRITTKYSESWTYGILEIRAQLPAGTGTWPAIWMMPTFSRYGGWPDSGEIDIMEHVGYAENVLHGTVHTEAFNHQIGTQKGGTTYSYDDVTTEFHTYKIEWLPDKIKFFVDNVNYYTFIPSSFSTCPTTEEWPFDDNFFLILNIAIGGDWGGAMGVDDIIFPTSMLVDFVRVYQSEEITNIIQGD